MYKTSLLNILFLLSSPPPPLSAEARKEYGDKVKTYTSTFGPLYHAMTDRKPKCHMKLITVLPDEKVALKTIPKTKHYLK